MQWWRGAVVYELDVRSFGDSDGDGIGDLDGLRARLGYLELLGVDVIWLEPTPIADRRTVDPLFGDLAAFDALVEAVVELRLRLVADLVRDNGHPQYHRSDRIRLALDRTLQTTPFDAAAVQDAVQHALGRRSCCRCIPRTTSTAPKCGYGCSSSSTGAGREPTPISAAIRACACGTHRL